MTPAARRRLPGKQRQRVPWPVLALVAGLSGAAVVAGSWSERLLVTPHSLSWASALGLVVALTASAYLHVEFRHGEDDVNALDLFEAALAPALLLAPGAWVIGMVAVAKAISEALLGVRPVKAAFNVAAWSAAAAVGSLVLIAMTGGHHPTAVADLFPLVVAMVAVTAVNQTAFICVLRLAEHRSFRRVLAEIRPAIVPGWVVGGAVTLSFGLLFAAACRWAPDLAWLLPVPLGALHWAGKAYAASRADVARVEGLHRATRTLGSSPDPDIAAFLEQVRAMFEADAVDLLTLGEGIVSARRAVVPSVSGADDDPPGPARQVPPGVDADPSLATALIALAEPARVTAVSPDPAIRAGLRRKGWRDCLVAQVPVVGGGRRALCVYDRKGIVTFDRGDLAVLEGLAGELGGALARADAEASLRTSEARFRALVEHSSDVVVVLDAAGVVTHALASASSSPLRLAVGCAVVDLVHPDDVPKVEALLADVVASPGPVGPLTWRVAAADGSWRHIETITTNLLQDPAVGGVVVNARDVTERERAAALVAGEAEVLATISRRTSFEETVDAQARVAESHSPGARYTVVLFGATPGARTRLGHPLPRHLIDELAAVIGVGSREAVPGPATVVVGDVGDDSRWAAAVGDGDVQAVWAARIGPSDGTGSVGLAVLHFDHPRRPDESDRRLLTMAAELAHLAVEGLATQARLVHQATHDALTGLPNRLLFMDRTAVALSRLSRSAMSVAVLFADLDGFKDVNDRLGHDVGDRLLVALAHRLEAIMRPSDTVARLGGDEFTILCEDIHGEQEAVAIATRVREVVRAPVAIEGHDLSVTASVGISHTADHRRAVPRLLEEADAAMYLAKRAGGDVHRVYDRTVQSRTQLALGTGDALRRAIEREELLVHYQPTVDLRNGHVVGAEALVRWGHPEHGVVGPLDFIALAEETGLIVPLGVLVLDEACSQGGRWAAAAGEGFTMSVNLSARQLADPSLAGIVAATLQRTRLPPSGLALEISESTLVADIDSTMAAMQALKDLGVTLAIDDFGTGHSSLADLRRLPVDVIKIDRSFVDGLGEDSGDEAIVAAVVDLAHALGMTVVAKGVETDAQVVALREVHCDVAQGYRFGRPVPADQLPLEPARIVDLRSPRRGP